MWNINKKFPFQSFLQNDIFWLALLFCSSAVFLFYNAFRFQLPIQYAGMYTLAAEEIANNGFSLPMEIPYYGPGGVPFAYPPLAFYIMAVVLKMKVSAITYLRFMPPIFSFLALIPLYLLVEELSASSLAAKLAVLYAAFSPTLYASHTWAAGIVRALAFVFLLWGIYCFTKAFQQEVFLWASLAGLFFGFTLLTHLFYGLFFALWVIGWIAGSGKLSSWRTVGFTSAVFTIVISPWFFTVISRYGVDVLINTFNSHGNASLVELIQNPISLLGWMMGKFATLANLPVSLAIMCIGLLYLFIKRQFGVPLIFLISVFTLSNEGTPAIIFLGAVMFGICSLALEAIDQTGMRWLYWVAAGSIGFSVIQIIVFGVQRTSQMSPSLNQSAFDVATYVQENISPHARYLVITGKAEAEWFPYLLKHEPFTSLWGSEWLGTYYEQTALQSRISYCKSEKSAECLIDLKLNIEPDDFLIVPKTERKLINELSSYKNCGRLAVFDRYVILQAQCLDQN